MKHFMYILFSFLLLSDSKDISLLDSVKSIEILYEHFEEGSGNKLEIKYLLEKQISDYVLFKIYQYNYPLSLHSQRENLVKYDSIYYKNSDKRELIDNIRNEIKDESSLKKFALYYLNKKYQNVRNIDKKKLIKTVDNEFVKLFQKEISQANNHKLDFTLTKLNIDSAWYNNKFDSLINQFSLLDKLHEDINCIKGIKEYQNLVYSSHYLKQDFPFYDPMISCSVKVISSDTINIKSIGKRAFLLPWSLNDSIEFHNPLLSKMIYTLIESDKDIISKLLLGIEQDKGYINLLLEETMERECK